MKRSESGFYEYFSANCKRGIFEPVFSGYQAFKMSLCQVVDVVVLVCINV